MSDQYKYNFKNERTLSEDSVWEKDVKKHFAGLPQNVWNIWTYGFLEIFNNAISHSEGKSISVIINKNKIYIDLFISDNGIGIFKNIMNNFNLIYEKDALLELAKGKRTTDKTQHSGQGIFFASKVFDEFAIVSNGIIFTPSSDLNLDKSTHIMAGKEKFSTLVYMRLASNSSKKLKDIFDEFSTEIPGDFDKTIIPIHLANSSDLVSRSQARRILSGLELFKEVTLDFKEIEYIGQAFADEIFRVFTNMNQGIKIITQNANTDVQYMINRAINTKL